MHTFTLHLANGKKMTVEGMDIFDACHTGNVDSSDVLNLVSYEDEQGAFVQVAARSNCGCVHHAEEGIPCSHDLESAGLSALC